MPAEPMTQEKLDALRTASSNATTRRRAVEETLDRIRAEHPHECPHCMFVNGLEEGELLAARDEERRALAAAEAAVAQWIRQGCRPAPDPKARHDKAFAVATHWLRGFYPSADRVQEVVRGLCVGADAADLAAGVGDVGLSATALDALARRLALQLARVVAGGPRFDDFDHTVDAAEVDNALALATNLLGPPATWEWP